MTTLEDSLLGYHVVATMAHLHGLAQAGLLTADQTEAALSALAEIADAPAPEPSPPEPQADLATTLAASLGADLAHQLERGRATHDQHATAFRLWTRDAILDLSMLLVQLRQDLTDLAGRAATTLAPGSEPPVLFGHYLIAYVEQLYRDSNRLKEAYVRTDILSLGAGDGAGVYVALDRGYVARLLGMHANTRNSVDAVGDRDFAIETLAALALIAARLARLIGDPALASPRASQESPPAPVPASGERETEASQTDESRAREATVANRLSRTRNPAVMSGEDWLTALVTLSRTTQGYDPVLGKIEAATARAVERTQAALRLAIDIVQDTPVPSANAAGRNTGALDRFISRGGTAPTVASAAIADTHGRIDVYRQWIAERRAAHATPETLRHYPAERAVTLLPHNDPPPARS